MDSVATTGARQNMVADPTLRSIEDVIADLSRPVNPRRLKTRKQVETRLDFPHADPVGECTVFNIGGNKYRLITKIRYNKQRVYIIHVLTHKEYDREKWKDDCNC